MVDDEGQGMDEGVIGVDVAGQKLDAEAGE